VILYEVDFARALEWGECALDDDAILARQVASSLIGISR
jgi:hypothetical protein